jgi:glucans biosynthesis protein
MSVMILPLEGPDADGPAPTPPLEGRRSAPGLRTRFGPGDGVSRCAPGSRGRGRRRGALAALLLALLAPAASGAFGLDDVAKQAEAQAKLPFRDPSGEVPRWLTAISYDQWRDVRFRPELALWRDAKIPFEVQFFHPGLFYDRTVQVHVVDAQGIHPVPFNPSNFDYGRNDFGSRVPQDLGYAGLRLHYPIKKRDYKDEVIVFLGASYFRAVGRDEVYGLSARALAVDTASPTGEEFPFFREFWLERPGPGAKAMVVYALLDSRRLTGAYRFAVYPGAETRVDIQSRIFFRAPVEKLGIGPLTSMFYHGENTVLDFEDFRPEVHDSDGLALHSSTGEWLWRPIDNRRRLEVSSFDLPDPKGFGLLQRDRDFDHYQDLEARYDLRPSAWVEPVGSWGRGRIELVEIPTDDEVNDNVAMYWVPEARAAPGEPAEYDYTLHWFNELPDQPPGGRVASTRLDRRDDTWRFVVDFVGKELSALPPETVLQAVVTMGSGSPDDGEIVEQFVEKNPVTGGFRLVFRVRPGRREPLPVRAFLQQGTGALTETWSYLLVP